MMPTLRKYLIAGLLVWIPLAATVLVVKLIVDLVDLVLLLFPERLHPENLWGFSIPGLGLILAFGVVLLTGALAANLVGRKAVEIWERVLGRIPLVRNIYNAFKQITATMLVTDKKSFRKVVLVEFPREGMWSIGFLTNTGIALESDALGEGLVAVFISTTPTPTTGFLVIVPADRVIEVDLSIEEAFKLILSMGVVAPDRLVRELYMDDPVAPAGAGS